MLKIGCGMLFLGLGVWILLWAFGIIQFSPRYFWVPFAVILIALGLRLLLTNNRQ